MPFESIYIQSLPRVPLTEAHRRLERLRDSLVAARTSTPIYFLGPRIVRSGRGPSVLRLAADPADHNTAATERRAQALGSR